MDNFNAIRMGLNLPLGDACLWDLSPNGVFLSEIVVALQL